MPELTHCSVESATSTHWREGCGDSYELECGSETAHRGVRAYVEEAETATVTRLGGDPQDEYLALLSSGVVELQSSDDDPRKVLRRGEVAYAGAADLRTTGPATLLRVSVPNGHAAPTIQLAHLGTRGLREALPPLGLLLAIEGAARARISGEDEPCDLDAGDAVWIAAANTGDEIAVEALEAGTEVVLVLIQP